MARYVTSVATPLSVAEAFAYMADVTHFVEWDPPEDGQPEGRLRRRRHRRPCGLRRAASDLVARHPALHVLIHNAGALDDIRQA